MSARPCNDYGNGGCTENGRLEPGFCKCKADAERMEMLEKALGRVREITSEVQDDLRNGFPVSAKRHLDEIAEVARAALDYRPVQMKGTE